MEPLDNQKPQAVKQGDGSENHANNNTQKAQKYKSGVRLVRGDEVIIKPVDWLWDGYMPRSKVVLLAGDPELGKTTIAINIAATITTAGTWPDGSVCGKAGNVLIWSGEDGIEDTLAPRLKAAGADMSKCHFIAAVEEEEVSRNFDPARDIERLEARMSEIPDLALLILDPIVSTIAGDSHQNAQVRRGLQPIVDLAERYNISVLGITHFAKGSSDKPPLERVIGSIAFGAVARLALVAAKIWDEHGSECRALVRTKSNLGKSGDGFKYEIEELTLEEGIRSSKVIWGEQILGSASEILKDAKKNKGDKQNILEEAMLFLEDILTEGERSPKDVMAAAEDAALSQASIRRAKKILGIESVKSSMNGGWVWKLPTEDAQDERRCSSKYDEHLWEN